MNENTGGTEDGGSKAGTAGGRAGGGMGIATERGESNKGLDGKKLIKKLQLLQDLIDFAIDKTLKRLNLLHTLNDYSYTLEDEALDKMDAEANRLNDLAKNIKSMADRELKSNLEVCEDWKGPMDPSGHFPESDNQKFNKCRSDARETYRERLEHLEELDIEKIADKLERYSNTKRHGRH